jgi:hypothetical protein
VILKIGEYYEMAMDYKRVKKGRVYKLIDGSTTRLDNLEGTPYSSLEFKDIETGKVIHLFDPPPKIFAKEVKKPKSEVLKERKEEKNKETPTLHLPKDHFKTISVSISILNNKGKILLHYACLSACLSAGKEQKTAVYNIKNIQDVKTIIWKE